MEIRKCVNGRIDKQTRGWELNEDSRLDTVVTIGPDRFYVTFYKRGAANWMQLRSLSSNKVEQRINIEFRLENE
jgi:hypothetical protein